MVPKKVNTVRGCCVAVCRKGPAWDQGTVQKERGNTPRERHCGRKNAPKRPWPPGRKSAIGGSSPEKVGCKRGAIGSTARGRRIARRRAFSAAGVIFVGRRQDPCAAGVSFFRGCTGGFCSGRVSAFPPPQTHSVDLPETAGHKFFTGGKCI